MMVVSLTDREVEEVKAAMHTRIRMTGYIGKGPVRYAPGALEERVEVCNAVLQKIAPSPYKSGTLQGEN